ncbi:hypothetical protein QAD02_002852 [Eretmocerus hayati]|uniref:Uncharacterized protein n=1 Tax=Eretmocerus hayati TaxID=131215 RepID=A0ACC2NL18_9HYME|nr:hypothetical protein QAD02_002852 [Eretmocerus hayati]
MGLAAAKKQAPILMYMEYKVTSPDHEFVVASRHELIPSVYAVLLIENGRIGDQKAVTHSEPTYVAIRSAKHCSSTDTHAYDFRRLAEKAEFRDSFHGEDGEMKPVLVIMSDGGPDENRRYQGVIAHAIEHFERYNSDDLFITTDAPGRSAFNPVERRMPPSSHELAGLILPHDQSGSHLDGSKKTVDTKLEFRNFEFDGQTLARVWNDLTIDSHPVVAEYADEHCKGNNPEAVDSNWYDVHVRKSHTSSRSSNVVTEIAVVIGGATREVLPSTESFFPPPFPLRRNNNGSLEIPTPEEMNENGSYDALFLRQSESTGLPVAYDYYYPSLRDQITDQICELCGAYFGNQRKKGCI